jgi:PadR family transcriptional regulator AphA
VLGLLDSGDGQSGYDLLKRVERGIGYMWAPAKSGLYTVLGRLEAAGLASSTTAKERGPTKAVYSITAAGRTALHGWLSDPTLELSPPRDPFLLKLFFARRVAPKAAAELVTAYRAHVARLLGEWERQEQANHDAPAIDLIPLRFALARARATLAWCDETLEILR